MGNCKIEKVILDPKFDFEKSKLELSEIVKKLESSNINLTESIELFEKANILREKCNLFLKEAEERISKIVIEN
jgi:exodeoxyribonuclease VII small subunit